MTGHRTPGNEQDTPDFVFIGVTSIDFQYEANKR